MYLSQNNVQHVYRFTFKVGKKMFLKKIEKEISNVVIIY